MRYAQRMSAFPGIEVTVQSSHVDMFGHVNHTCYLEFMEWCRFAWAEHFGFPIPEMIQRERVAPAILRVQIQFRRECRYGDKLRVGARPLSARRDIGRIKQEIWRRSAEGAEELVCDAELTFVMMNLDTRTATTLPQAFVELVPKAEGE